MKPRRIYPSFSSGCSAANDSSITKHGRPVAELVPVTERDRDKTRKLVESMRSLRASLEKRGVRLSDIRKKSETLRELSARRSPLLMAFVVDSSIVLSWLLPDERPSPRGWACQSARGGNACRAGALDAGRSAMPCLLRADAIGLPTGIWIDSSKSSERYPSRSTRFPQVNRCRRWSCSHANTV